MKKTIIISTIILLISLPMAIVSGCAAPTPAPAPLPVPTPEPAIPEQYTTYTEQGLFSISYPPEWEPALSIMEELEQEVKESIESITSDLPLERTSVIFIAGIPKGIGYEPNTSVLVEYLPEVRTQDEAIEAEMRGLRQVVQDYHEFSRIKTTIDGREATIIDYEATWPEGDKIRQLVMMTLVDEYVWLVICAPPTGEFEIWDDDFHSIVRSLRILK